MRILQTIIQKLACVAVLAGGAALAAYSLTDLYALIVAQVPDLNPLVRLAIVTVAIALPAFALVPIGLVRPRNRELRFDCDSGSVTAQLDSNAASLNKEFNAYPVVKKGTVRLTPTKAADKANVHADVHLLIPAGSSLRETSTQLQVLLKELASERIGHEEIGTVTVNVVKSETAGQTTNMKAPIAEVAEPVAQAIPEPEPLVEEPIVEEPIVVEDGAPVSENLVTYEESVQAAEEEERSLAGDTEEETELPVAWETEEPETEETPVVLGEGDQSSDEDTSFDALAIEESTHDEEDEENRPASGV